MATLLKARAHKPLAVNRAQFGYGSRKDVNDGAQGVTVYIADEDSNASYSLHLTDEEVERLFSSYVVCKYGADAAYDIRKALKPLGPTENIGSCKP